MGAIPEDVAYVWHGALHAATVAATSRHQALPFARIIWDKTRLVIGRGDCHWQHEPAYHGQERQDRPLGRGSPTTVWGISHPKSRNGARDAEAGRMHVESDQLRTIRRGTRRCTNHSSGSGTTIIAAEMTGRACFAVELAPVYVDVAVQRWQAFTGEQARLASTDQDFEQVSRHRKNRPSMKRRAAITRSQMSQPILSFWTEIRRRGGVGVQLEPEPARRGTNVTSHLCRQQAEWKRLAAQL